MALMVLPARSPICWFLPFIAANQVLVSAAAIRGCEFVSELPAKMACLMCVGGSPVGDAGA
eukprot:4803736-Prorocentrum_lima.AAC.1